MLILSHRPNLQAVMQFKTLPPRSESYFSPRKTEKKLGTCSFKKRRVIQFSISNT